MQDVIPLWDDPGAPSEEVEFIGPQGELMVRNVTVPTLTPFLPDTGTAPRAAVVVAPGGGFRTLAWDYEGTDVAQWLAARGIAAFVLKYRLVDTGPAHDDFTRHVQAWIAEAQRDGTPMRARAGRIAPHVETLAAADATGAVRLLRQRAAEWDLPPDRIGMIGFSAGAFVTTDVATDPDRTARPDFVAPIYGGGPVRDVPADAPPMFAAIAADDSVCLDATLETFAAWRSAGCSAELHVYDRGGHGFGAKKQGLPVDGWLDRLMDWLMSGPLAN